MPKLGWKLFGAFTQCILPRSNLETHKPQFRKGSSLDIGLFTIDGQQRMGNKFLCFHISFWEGTPKTESLQAAEVAVG